MNHQPEICPDCETGHLHLDTYGDEFEYRDRTLRLEGLTCLVCNHCGAEIFRPEHIRANDRLIAEAKRRADGLLLAEEIRKLRKSLGITQHEAAAIFGGGANAFSKYERGEVIQSVAMDRLLRLVARYPILLSELAMAAGVRPRTMTQTETYTVEQRLSVNDPDFRRARKSRQVVEFGSNEWRKSA